MISPRLKTQNRTQNTQHAHPLQGWIPRLGGQQVLVIGDLLLDDYVVGEATRLSREAPIPVLEYRRSFSLPGGAANPAHNIVALQSRASVVGVIGDDDAGRTLRAYLTRLGIDIAGVVVDRSRPTTTKGRWLAEGTLLFPQQVARMDRLDRRPVSGEIAARLVAAVRAGATGARAILVSDYRLGVVTPELVAAARTAARSAGALLCVDSQGDLEKFSGFDLVRCNAQEAGNVLQQPLVAEIDFMKATGRLLTLTGARAVVISRGADGLSCQAHDSDYIHLPVTNRSEVYDVTGAGDTLIAVLTLALVAGAPLVVAAQLANAAAGLVVRKLGNAVCTPEELAEAVRK